MTELEMMLSFMDNLSYRFPELHYDIEFLQRVVNHVSKPKTEDYLHTFVKALQAFSSAVVAGVNSRRFAFKQTVFRVRSLCVLPRFLEGFTTRIFHLTGELKTDWDRDAFEALLHVLAFVKRFKHKTLRARADDAAKQEFIGFQKQTRPVHAGVAAHLRSLWNYFVRDIEKFSTLGFPGPGATLDESHPYTPTFSYLNTWDPKLPDSIRQFYDACFANHTGFPDARSFLIGPGKQNTKLPSFYPLVENPILRAVCVPKNSTVSRVITVTNVGNTIVGACYRNTIKSLWKHHGIEDQLNVDDQSKSHSNLERNFQTAVCLDLKGGSSCFTNYLNSQILPDFFQDFLEYSSYGSTFEVDGVKYPVTTQLMGDSISTALLTTSLYLVIVLASYYSSIRDYIDRAFEAWYGSYAICGRSTFVEDYEAFFEKCFRLRRRDIQKHFDSVRRDAVNIVGDDMVFPVRYETEVRFILKSLGITINDAKSSTSTSNHKESCGCWIISEPSGSHRRIYPFRAPEGDTREEQLQTASQFLQRTSSSTFSEELALTLAQIYGHELLCESHRPDDVGTPHGSGLPSRIITKSSSKYLRVDDSTYFYFRLGQTSADSSIGSDFVSNLESIVRGRLVRATTSVPEDHRVAVRYSRRAPVAKTRVGHFLDCSKRDADAYFRTLSKAVRCIMLFQYVDGIRRFSAPVDNQLYLKWLLNPERKTFIHRK